MSFKYQALLGNTVIDADSIVVDELVAEKGIIANLDVTKDLHVEGVTELNELILPIGSGEGKVLTSDAVGKAYWNDNGLAGDITGPTSANVQHHKWIGHWDVLVPYLKFNRVTHEYIEYRAKDDNLGMEPSLDPDGVWEAVLSYRPDTVFEEKAQPLRNKTDVDVVDLTVRNSAKFTIQPTSMFEMTPRYLVGTGANKDELRWANDLDAKQLSCRNTFYYENDGRADAGKVLTCVGNTGACNWEYPTQTNAVTMGGDIMGPSNDAVIKTLAGGTIQVNELLTIHDIPTLPADIVYENKAQPLRNKTDVDVVTLMVRDSMKLQLPTLNSGVFALKYLVGWNNPDFNDCKWVNDLYAPIVSAQSQLLYPVGASAGKVLSCVDATGLAAWTDPPNTTVSMAGDVTGTSSVSVVNTLAGGTIPVNQLVTLTESQFLQNKLLSALNSYFVSDTDTTKIIRYGLGPASTNTTLTIQSSATANRTVIFPDANDTLVGKNTSDVLKNKTINDVSNSVAANGLRAGTAWNVPLGGSAPVAYNILMYNGTYNDARWIDPSTLLPALGGDVTGPYGATTVNTLAGGTIPVNQLLTLNGEQIMTNKGLAGTIIFSDDTLTKTFRVMFGSTSPNTTTMLIPTSTVSLRQIMLPDATDTLMGKVTTDIMKNKTITDVSNTVYANGIRNGSTWTSTFAGAAPTTDQVLSYNGTNAVWGAAAPLVTLAGDVTGLATNTVVAKATTDFTVGRTISASTGDRRKKIVVHEEGTATDPMDHRFPGLGVQSFQMRYQVSTTANSHVFYAATSATASNELFKIAGDGNCVANGAMISRVSAVDTWRTPTFQGAWMGWNRGGQSYNGQTVFANQQGLGTGGWEWVNFASNNIQDPAGAASMTLDKWGSLTLRGNLTGNGNATISGNLTVGGKVISNGVPDAFSGNWWSADTDIILLTVPLQSSGQFCNLRETITSINFSAWTVNTTGIFLPVAGYFRISYRFRLASRTKINIMLKCNVSVGGTNHPSLYTFDMGLTYEHDLHCEAIVNISAPNMWVTYPKLTVYDSSQVTSPKDFDLFTGHFTIEKMK